MASRHLIIGVDPGSTIGIAAVDLSGNFVHSSHSLGGGIETAISIIEKWGTPSMIAVDVRPAPSFAVRMAASFNVPIYVPEKPWREEQKSALLHHLHATVANAHERDALSAAVMAYRANQNTLGQVAAEKSLTPEQRERLKHLLLQGIRQSYAVEMLTKKETTDDLPEAPKPSEPPRSASHVDLHSQLIVLERANAEQRKRIALLEIERDALLHKLRQMENTRRLELMRDRLVNRLQYDTSRLKAELERMRHGGKKKMKGKAVPPQKRQEIPFPPKEHANLKALDERALDLERMILEYRKGRPGAKPG